MGTGDVDGEAAPTTAVGGVTPAGWSGVGAGHRGRRLPPTGSTQEGG